MNCKIIILNNGGIGSGTEKYPTDPIDNPPRALIYGARYDKMMEAFGGKGFNIDDPKDLKGALAEATAHKGPALVNVKLHHAAGRKQQEFGWLTT